MFDKKDLQDYFGKKDLEVLIDMKGCLGCSLKYGLEKVDYSSLGAVIGTCLDLLVGTYLVELGCKDFVVQEGTFLEVLAGMDLEELFDTYLEDFVDMD